MLSAYHAIISALTRDLSSLYYAIYIFSILSIFLLREGVISLLVWPESELGTESANIFAISMAGSSISLFTSRILQLKHASPAPEPAFLPVRCVVRITLFFRVTDRLRLADKNQPYTVSCLNRAVRCSAFEKN